MDSSFTSSQSRDRASRDSTPSPRAAARARFVEQYIVRRQRVRQMTGAAGIGLLGLFVGYAIFVARH